MCEWCGSPRAKTAFPRRTWLIIPIPGQATLAYFPVRSESVQMLETRATRTPARGGYMGAIPERSLRCRWGSASEPGPCPEPGAWRVSSDFVVGHLCEAHRDRASQMESTQGIENWLRRFGIQIASRFPSIRPSVPCDYAAHPGTTRECTRLACSAEVISSAFEVCEGHMHRYSSVLASARERVPPEDSYRGWWWQ